MALMEGRKPKEVWAGAIVGNRAPAVPGNGDVVSGGLTAQSILCEVRSDVLMQDSAGELEIAVG
jgi:hypothetical protein